MKAEDLNTLETELKELTPSVLQLYTFWVEPKNYVDVTRCWYAEHLPFPLNFFLPGRMQRHQLAKLCLQRADQSLEVGEELEKEVSLRIPPPPIVAWARSQVGGAFSLWSPSSAVPGRCRVHEPAVPATRLAQVLLRGLVSSSRPVPGPGPPLSHLCPPSGCAGLPLWTPTCSATWRPSSGVNCPAGSCSST